MVVIVSLRVTQKKHFYVEFRDLWGEKNFYEILYC